MAVKLSARMMALADLVTPGARLADVGTDHGYLPVFLCQTGKIQKAIAMDINRGPLQRAEAHVKEYGLQGKIELRLSDGLHALWPGEADTILIAGMGGALMKRILDEGETILAESPKLILQPQSEIPSVRAYLREIGYVIVDEDCVLEDGKFYFMMKALRVDARAGDFRDEGYGNGQKDARKKNGTDSEFGNKRSVDAFGPVLLKKRHPVLRLFLERELATVQDIRQKLSGQLALDDMSENLKSEKLKTRLREMEDRQCLLERALRLYES